MDIKISEFKSADSRDYSKPVKFMTIEELYARNNLIKTLEDAKSIIWITRERKRD